MLNNNETRCLDGTLPHKVLTYEPSPVGNMLFIEGDKQEIGSGNLSPMGGGANAPGPNISLQQQSISENISIKEIASEESSVTEGNTMHFVHLQNPNQMKRKITALHYDVVYKYSSKTHFKQNPLVADKGRIHGYFAQEMREAIINDRAQTIDVIGRFQNMTKNNNGISTQNNQMRNIQSYSPIFLQDAQSKYLPGSQMLMAVPSNGTGLFNSNLNNQGGASYTQGPGCQIDNRNMNSLISQKGCGMGSDIGRGTNNGDNTLALSRQQILLGSYGADKFPQQMGAGTFLGGGDLHQIQEEIEGEEGIEKSGHIQHTLLQQRDRLIQEQQERLKREEGSGTNVRRVSVTGVAAGCVQPPFSFIPPSRDNFNGGGERNLTANDLNQQRQRDGSSYFNQYMQAGAADEGSQQIHKPSAVSSKWQISGAPPQIINSSIEIDTPGCLSSTNRYQSSQIQQQYSQGQLVPKPLIQKRPHDVGSFNPQISALNSSLRPSQGHLQSSNVAIAGALISQNFNGTGKNVHSDSIHDSNALLNNNASKTVNTSLNKYKHFLSSNHNIRAAGARRMSLQNSGIGLATLLNRYVESGQIDEEQEEDGEEDPRGVSAMSKTAQNWSQSHGNIFQHKRLFGKQAKRHSDALRGAVNNNGEGSSKREQSGTSGVVKKAQSRQYNQNNSSIACAEEQNNPGQQVEENAYQNPQQSILARKFYLAHESIDGDSVITPGFRLRDPSHPHYGAQFNHNNRKNTDESYSQDSQRQNSGGNAPEKEKKNVLMPAGSYFMLGQAPKQEDNRRTILDITDFVAEEQTVYYLYMPDDLAKQYQKGNTLGLGENENPAPVAPAVSFPNISKRNLTLVFELFDIFVRIIDPKKEDCMDLSDERVKCFHVSQKPPQIVFIKCDEKEMIHALKDLQAYAELILYSCLPDVVMQCILDLPSLKELKNVFSYVLTSKDCIHTDEAILKDITKLLPTRNKDQIIVVDVNENNVDTDVSAFIFQNRYSGQDYNELKLLKTAVKSQLSALTAAAQAPPALSSNFGSGAAAPQQEEEGSNQV